MDQIQSVLSSSYSTFESTTLLLVLATIAVITRFVSKAFTKARFSFDDYWITFSLIVFGTYAGVQYWVIFNRGGGLDLQKTREMNLVELVLLYHKAVFFTSILFVLGTTTTKISILLYYRRIFAVQTFKRTTLVLIAATVLAWLTTELGLLIRCSPPRLFWEPWIAGHCMDINIFMIVMGVIDVLLDILILCLPISMIPGLKLPLRHRINLSMIFLLGGFVCIIAIVRLVLSFHPGQQRMNVGGFLWANIHLGTAIICACLPTYRPILSKCAHAFASIQLSYKSRFSSKPELDDSNPNPYMTDGSKSHRSRSAGGGSDQEHILGAVTGISHEKDSARVDGHPPHHIIVESAFSVV